MGGQKEREYKEDDRMSYSKMVALLDFLMVLKIMPLRGGGGGGKNEF